MTKTGTSSKAEHALIREFFQLYPLEAAAMLNLLSPEEILDHLQRQSVHAAVNVFLGLNPDIAVHIVDKMETDFFIELFSALDPARGAALLARLDQDTLANRLGLLPVKVAREYQDLMTYPADRAGHMMDPRVATFLPNETIEEALRRIRTFRNRRIVDLCVVDEEGILQGVVALQEVAVSEPGAKLRELITKQPISIQAMSSQEEVAQLLNERKLASLPVVDLDGRLLGIIRYDALITAARQEATQDVQSMFGAGRDERALSKVSFAIRKRLPWLEINLATAFLAASVVGLFEDTIARFTALAVFLPVVAGQSGNTGSQALAVTMRGLALREIRLRHWFRVSRKEMLVGFVNGVAVALTTSLIVYFWMDSFGLALVIGVAMVLSMVVAGLFGAIIPIVLQAFGQDPAQSSSIVLTTVTDVVGFMSFLGLATIFSNMLVAG